MAAAKPMYGGVDVEEARTLICEMCRMFYDQGWVSGTGGGISIRASDGHIVMAPSGVQKERMVPSDMFILDAAGEVLEAPTARPPPYKPPKLSECSPLFMSAYEMRNAGAVLHSHSLNAVLATVLDPQATEFRVTHLEMIKGIEGGGFYGNLGVPIIENTARECELTDRLRAAIAAYPQANAVLVRRHGVYVWGKDWIQAKTQAECYDYLFESAIRMHALGIDASRPPAPLITSTANGLKRPAASGAADDATNGTASAANGAAQAANSTAADPSKRAKLVHSGRRRPAAIVLDIEGTVAPISFVADVMFPYAKEHVQAHLEATWDSEQTQADVDAIRQQAAADGSPAIPPASAGREAVLPAVTAWVHAAIAADSKVPALKGLQGRVWRSGFESGALMAQLFRDVPDALAQWRNEGLKTYIYSSGSREAQRLFFGYSQVGDLRPYLSGFFDPTSSGPKTQPASYKSIALSLGLEPGSGNPSESVLFATDVLAEAQAAQEAGWEAVLVVRLGNKPLPEGHGIRIVESMTELL